MLLLIRHGETDWNKEKRMQGHRDIPMNDYGINQIKELALKLADAGVKADVIISSPLERAKQTATIIAEKIGFTEAIRYDEDFIERDCGLLEGVVWNPELDLDDPKYKMETVEEMCERAGKALAKYSFSDEHKVMIVSHGAILTAMKTFLSKGKYAYGESIYPIIQGNVLCCEKGQDGEAAFYQMF